jgi:hypothetical protein
MNLKNMMEIFVGCVDDILGHVFCSDAAERIASTELSGMVGCRLDL